MTGIVACDLSNKGDTDETDDIPREVVFSMVDDSENENHQIYVMDINGANLKQLTFFENEEAFQPSWSSDGTQIVFTTSLESSSLGLSIFLMNADGTNVRPMKTFVNPSFDFVQPGSNPRWSPDGTKITFQWCVNCEIGGRNTEIFVYDFLKDSIFQFTNHYADDKAPDWSQYGSKILFGSNRSGPDSQDVGEGYNLFEIDIITQELKQITDSDLVASWVWNPNNNSFIIQETGPNSNLYALDAETVDTVSNTDLTTSPDLSQFRAVKWSQKGNYLLLYYSGNNTPEYYFYNKDTDETNKLPIPNQFLGVDLIETDSL
ncbi:MAG: hypothetical protein BalsKO_09460 [Balneolaceae bacterium]